MNNTIKSIIILQKNIRQKLNTVRNFKLLIDNYNNIIIQLLNNIQSHFHNKKINLNNYNDLNNNLNKLFNKLDLINNECTISVIYKNSINIFNKKLVNIEIEIKKFFKNISLKKIVDIIEFMVSKNWDKNIDNKELNDLYFYNSFFNSFSVYIDTKYTHYKQIKKFKNGYVFIKKTDRDKKNKLDELNEVILHILIDDKIIVCEGYFTSDNFNIIRRNNRFKNKIVNLKKLVKIEGIDEIFSERYIEQISLRDFIVNNKNELSDNISIAYEKLHFYKDMSLTELLLTFNTSTLERQREMLTILILSDSQSASLASLMYDILIKKEKPDKAKELYFSLHSSVQKLFDIALTNFNQENKKLKEINIDDIPFDKKITMSKAPENAKIKAMEKFKQMKGGGLFNSSSDSKVEAWLNGFIRIPFGIYKNNNLFTFLESFPIKIKELLNILNDKYNIDGLKVLSKLDLNKTLNLNTVIIEIGKLLMKSEFSNFYLTKCSKLINKWNEYKLNRKVYIKEVRQTLDNAVYGNDEGKGQIEKLIGQWINGKTEGFILGLQGPPGVGKTTIAKRGLCKCLKDANGEPRPFAFLPLGGSTNGSTLVGHNYTYIGSTWGRFVDILMESKCMNPVIFIDEIDKVSRTARGNEIIGILTHLTDLSQNDEFEDKYFSGIKFDFSKCLIVFSYNDANLIDPILRDRITEINLKPLNITDKLVVSKKFLLPEIMEGVGLDSTEIELEDDCIKYIIETYTYEAGVRKLKEKFLDIMRHINLDRIYGDVHEFKKIKIDKELVDKILEKKQKITFKKIPKKPYIGYVNGLYATTTGIGGLTVIEVVKSFSDQKLGMTLTGSQGDVMKESMKCAKTIAWNILPTEIKKFIKKDWEENGSWGLHIHTPDAATPKDGPSAGGAITLAIISRLSNVAIKNIIALTGEIDLKGNIKKIGGLTAKLLGAHKAGVLEVFIPEENKEDLDLIQKENILPNKNFKVTLVDSIKDLIENCLVDNDLEFNYENI